MRKLIVVGFLAALTSSESWAEIGIGASVRSESASIHIPWQISPEFRLEGELLRGDMEDESFVTLQFGLGTNIQQIPITTERETSALGLGGFWTPELDEDLNLLLGVRVNYLDSESSTRQVNLNGDYTTRTEDVSGTSIMPTLGLEYSVRPAIKLAVEVGYYFRDLDGDAVARSIPDGPGIPSATRTDISEEQNGTSTSVVLRYFF